jgi:hypothetical protein
MPERVFNDGDAAGLGADGRARAVKTLRRGLIVGLNCLNEQPCHSLGAMLGLLLPFVPIAHPEAGRESRGAKDTDQFVHHEGNALIPILRLWGVHWQ